MPKTEISTARDMWKDWNKQISERKPEQLPEGLSPGDEVYLECGAQ